MSDDYRSIARERMKGFCRVCPVCDGRACSGEVPGMGGLTTGASFRNNVSALANVTLNMTVLHDVKSPDTSTKVLGMELKVPALAAPIGGVSFNMTKEDVSEDAYIDAVLGGCAQAGSVGCTGDGVPPFIIDAATKALKTHKGIPFIKPWEGKELYEKLDRVMDCNPLAVGMDVDAAGLVTLRKMGRPVTPMSTAELRQVIAYVHKKGQKFIVKGIMTPQDAEKSVAAGADGIVVSNHGGRILDHCPGTAVVLPRIAAAVRGRLAVFVDGGVRTGVDVLKMLALGADAVLIGRPVCVAAIGGLTEGVSAYFTTITQQLSQAMLLTGCSSIDNISPEIVYCA
ncbi:MAG: alpha-hydroxy-acid oxidizing protein [Desulfovibrio sp.]|nr:alpha-hydroxy-acid oxidizing protein [Desulfovibrio sp.]